MTTKDEKAVGTPVFTWQGHMTDLLAVIGSSTDTKQLADMAKALLGAQQQASGRRDALRAIRGKGMFDPESPRSGRRSHSRWREDADDFDPTDDLLKDAGVRQGREAS